MITGVHALIYAEDADQVRQFFRDTLGFPHVDAHGGWLIFALPPAELAVHPADDGVRNELYLMCSDLRLEMTALESRGVRCSEVEEARWGSVTRIRLPGGGEVGLYQPNHPSPVAPPSY